MKAVLLLLVLTINVFISTAYNPISQPNVQKNCYFTENNGQIRDQHNQERKDIDFELRTNNGMSVFVGSASIHYQFSKAAGITKNHSVEERMELGFKKEQVNFSFYRMDVSLLGANKNAEIIKSEQQEYYEQYFTEWTSEQGIKAHTFSKITYKEIYPHIDWVLYTRGGKMKHEFIVREGGNPKDIQIKYEGASELELDNQGFLIAKTPMGTIKENAPVSYTSNGKSVASKFQLNNKLLSYQIEPYIGTLVIDPSLEWGTYYGDAGYDYGNDVTNDLSNNVYICGSTFSSAGIATSGAHESIKTSYLNSFLAKFNSSGVRLWATYYGGYSNSQSDVITDNFNNVYLCGSTREYLGISTPGSYQPLKAGSEDAFLVKFDSSGKRIWATYYGGENSDIGLSVTMDKKNNIYLCGYTTSTTGIASLGAFQPSIGGSSDGFIVKFSNTGSRIWASYFGGNRSDGLVSIHSDKSDNIYLSGNSTSDTGISTLGAHQKDKSGTASSTEAILVKFDSSGNRLWATYYGGYNPDQGLSVITDQLNNVFMCGFTTSDTGIATSGSYQPFRTAYSREGFLVKFDSSGSRIWGTYFGDSSEEISDRITVDEANNIYMTGRSKSNSGIASAGAYQPTNAGDWDAFLAKFNSSGARIWSTYFGGISTDLASGISMDALNNIYIVGSTASTSGIATTGAHKTSWSYYYDVFLAKFCFDVQAGTLNGPDTVCATKSYSLSTTVAGGTFYSKTGKTSISGGTLTGLSTGKDTILYVLANTCSSDTVAKEIWINPAATAGIISVKDTLCLYDSASISSGIAGGTWISVTGKTVVSGGFVKALTTGSDTLLYLVTNSCGTDTAIKYIETIHCSTNIAELHSSKWIEITPNPTQGKININSALTIQTIKITNILGETIYTEQCKQKNRELDISTYPKGLYLIKINDRYVHKLIKE